MALVLCFCLDTTGIVKLLTSFVGANLELVDKSCYLGDMWSVDGDADAAVETKIRIGWNKFSSWQPGSGNDAIHNSFPWAN